MTPREKAKEEKSDFELRRKEFGDWLVREERLHYFLVSRALGGWRESQHHMDVYQTALMHMISSQKFHTLPPEIWGPYLNIVIRNSARNHFAKRSKGTDALDRRGTVISLDADAPNSVDETSAEYILRGASIAISASEIENYDCSRTAIALLELLERKLTPTELNVIHAIVKEDAVGERSRTRSIADSLNMPHATFRQHLSRASQKLRIEFRELNGMQQQLMRDLLAHTGARMRVST